MRVAVIGAGVSGLTAAYLLARAHEVTLFEREARLGGHVHTHDVVADGRSWALDTGFMVYNPQTAPLFARLLDELGIESRTADMSLSIRCHRCGLEFSTEGLDGFFARRSRLFDRAHWRLLGDIRRFSSVGRLAVEEGQADGSRTLGDLLRDARFGEDLARHFVLPMAAAIWAVPPVDALGLPLAACMRFHETPGSRSRVHPAAWRMIAGGSRRYVAALAARLGAAIRVGTPAVSVSRHDLGVDVLAGDGSMTSADALVVATHADEALKLLSDPSHSEESALGAVRYVSNRAWLHRDDRRLPREPYARAAWNCEMSDCFDRRAPISVTCDLGRLQGVRARQPLLCTLNPPEPVAGEILAQATYAHPLIDAQALAAQQQLARISGRRRTFYCGAYLGYGLHEDGVRSAVAVAAELGVDFATSD